MISVIRKTHRTLFLFVLFFSISEADASEGINWKRYFSLINTRYPDSQQLLIAIPVKRKTYHAKLYTFEYKNLKWHRVFPEIKAVNGYKGFAPPGKKSEGDGRSPSGIYGIGDAFGYYKQWKTRLYYRSVSRRDIWIDDVRSDDYNKWVTYHPGNYSHEKMKRKDHLYELGIIIEYNMNPVIKGKGSAIFIHIWRNPHSSTNGCIAISERSIKQLLSWLDKKKKPAIIMGNEREISAGNRIP